MRLPLACALVLGATAASGQTVANVAARGQCSTAGVTGVSRQLVATQICMFPGLFVNATPRAGITLSESRLFSLAQASTRDALWAAARVTPLTINSMFRTLADQYVLYHSGACGLAATPGTSNHQTGVAVDLANWSAAMRAMLNAGCRHPYPGTDDVHFDCPGTDRRDDSVRAFQRLWNVNNPGDRLDEDGAYGPLTAARVARTPANGFARDGCPSAPPDGGTPMPDGGTPMPDGGTVRDVPVVLVDAVVGDVNDAGDANNVNDAGDANNVGDAGDVGVGEDIRDASATDALRDVDPADDIPDGAVSIDEATRGGCQCRAGVGGLAGRGPSPVWIALGALLLRRRRARPKP